MIVAACRRYKKENKTNMIFIGYRRLKRRQDLKGLRIRCNGSTPSNRLIKLSVVPHFNLKVIFLIYFLLRDEPALLTTTNSNLKMAEH